LLSFFLFSSTALDADTPDGECALPPERGLCRENFTRYHWDKELGDCKAFSYSGCAGNANNFGSQEECQKFCKGKLRIVL
ncbi:serine protease inhibitor, putative, partial [Ixodes scapularis]